MHLPEKNIDLTCVGILVVDALGKTINEFPAEGTSVYYDSVKLLPGGCAYNTGVGAKRLG
jgi:sugar/nucleoside kinase (ribokinase family)